MTARCLHLLCIQSAVIPLENGCILTRDWEWCGQMTAYCYYEKSLDPVWPGKGLGDPQGPLEHSFWTTAFVDYSFIHYVESWIGSTTAFLPIWESRIQVWAQGDSIRTVNLVSDSTWLTVLSRRQITHRYQSIWKSQWALAAYRRGHAESFLDGREVPSQTWSCIRTLWGTW